ncbi:MAG TPA: DUF2950 domain-containing protein [Tepidisphaeraceae bacterium]|jgi:hypothetical protein|nr:DUF2950 domain-containing protein [Tepidisphaeraceae bacterium]
MNHPSLYRGRFLSLALAGGLLAIAGCNSQPSKPAQCSSGDCCSAPDAKANASHDAKSDATDSASSAPKTFATAEDAGSALKGAAIAGDQQALLGIFGSEGQQLVFSGDPVEEENGMKKFAGHLAEYMRVDHQGADKAVLYIGLKNWPFPIPLVKSDKGWSFDTAAGKEELLNRRIGENELNAISVCRAYVAAQKAYASKPRSDDKIIQYARHFRSSDGKHDGLYWAAGENEEISPMGPLVAEAQAEGYLKNPPNGQHHPYHGYFFHILTSQGEAAPGGKMDYIVDGRLTKGFAMIAWPDSWGASGVMTFIVNQDGKVYQKNLGEKTADEVKGISEYNPDKTWEEVKD